MQQLRCIDLFPIIITNFSEYAAALISPSQWQLRLLGIVVFRANLRTKLTEAKVEVIKTNGQSINRNKMVKYVIFGI